MSHNSVEYDTMCPMTDISPLTSGTPARHTSTRAVVSYITIGALAGGALVTMVGIWPIIIVAALILIARAIL